MAYIKNWRDVQPNIAHLSAVHWGCLRSIKEGDDDDRHRLDRVGEALPDTRSKDARHPIFTNMRVWNRSTTSSAGREKCCLRISVIP